MLKPNNQESRGQLSIIETQKEWESVLETLNNYDCYHTFEYHELSKLESEKPVLLHYREKNYTICLPLLIRKIKDTNYYDATSVYGYAGPLEKNLDNKFDNGNFKEAFNAFLTKNNIITVFSRLNPFVEMQESVLSGLGEIVTLGKVVTIDLTKSLQEQRADFSKTTKRYLNKARRKFKVSIGNDAKNIEVFKKLYYENMERVNAKDDYFFESDYYTNMLNSTKFGATIIFAEDMDSGETASAAIMIRTNKIIQYHLSGTKADYLEYSPIRLLIDETRIMGTDDGFAIFNLGGGLGNNDDSLLRFKSSFSKDFKNFKTWRYISNQEIYNKLIEGISIEKNINFFPLYRYLKK